MKQGQIFSFLCGKLSAGNGEEQATSSTLVRYLHTTNEDSISSFAIVSLLSQPSCELSFTIRKV